MQYPDNLFPQHVGVSPLLAALARSHERANQSFRNGGSREAIASGMWRLPNGDIEWSSSSSAAKRAGSEPAGREGGTPSLGITRQQFHPDLGGDASRAKKNQKKKPKSFRQIRRERHADQREAARIFWSYADKMLAKGESIDDLAGGGVTCCGRHQVPELETQLVRQMDKVSEEFQSWITGRQMCGLRWVCPVCTARKAEDDRRLINAALEKARRTSGLWPIMLTLTTRHSKREAAWDVRQGVRTAEQRLKRLKCWEKLRDRSEGYGRCFEWTYGKSGHHPHYHTVILVYAETEEEAMAAVRRLQPSYMDQLQKAGRDGRSAAAWKHSFHVGGAAAVAEYVTKWGQVEEITGAQAKDGRGESLTPWQLLRLSRTDPDPKKRAKYAAIWWEIIQATKGASQLYKSEKFSAFALAALEEEASEEAIEDAEGGEDEPPEPEVVRSFGIREKGQRASAMWQLASIRTLGIREAAEAHRDIEKAREAVKAALAGPTDDEVIQGPPPDPDNDDDGGVEFVDREDVDNR